MALVTAEVYQYSISQAEENIVQRQQAGFAMDICSMMKLMFSHVVIHCLENKDIFTKEQELSINNIINELV
jgi:hypothetical protein